MRRFKILNRRTRHRTVWTYVRVLQGPTATSLSFGIFSKWQIGSGEEANWLLGSEEANWLAVTLSFSKISSQRGGPDIVTIHSPRDTDMRLPGAGPASPLQANLYRPLPCDLGVFKRYSMECVQPLCHFIDLVLCVPLLELFAVQARAGEIFVGAVLAPRQIGL
eukprot:COSAG01_NODE_8729_length_2680_cov_132.629213_2_plen_163_part_01